jgi:hypothetical protein
MNHRRAILAAVALSAAAVFPVAALETIGEITYVEGGLEIARGGAALAPSLVKEGLALANFDLLKTGSDGRVELRISSAAAPATTVTVSPRTQFSVEIGKVGGKQQTTLDLVAGSVAMKCTKLTAGQSMRVHTETAFLGVRGTSFTVTAPASGDILVTCDEGEVECTDEKGATLLAAAGEAIEKPSGKPLARLAVAAAALAQYRRDWMDRQAADLQRDPLKLVNFYRTRLNRQLRSFDRQYKAFVRYQRIFDAWDAQDRAGTDRQPIAQLREKASLTIRLWSLRGTLFRLERTWVRLLELRDSCRQRGISGRVGLLKSESFFRLLDLRGGGVELRRALIRWRSLQFALRNDGQVPGGAFDPVDWKAFFKK